MPASPTHPLHPELALLLDLTSIPTAAGREGRVIRFIERWAIERPDLALQRDEAGNLVLRRAAIEPTSRPIYITAHLDHPAFVVERILGPATLLASFRGGVLEAYFKNAPVEVFAVQGGSLRGIVTERTKKEPFPECHIELEGDESPAERCAPGDIARWAIAEPRIEQGLLHAHACDDLSAVAAALALMDRLRAVDARADVRLLFTRAEEIGFIGAIAACRLETMPKDARVIALENSRSFAESPIGGGPIVRVGDRISVFHPGLTGAIARVAEKLAAKTKDRPEGPFLWQRRLMPGGACEASTFQSFGYEATCVCLPLGNYHNMADLERVQAGDPTALASARAAHEYISTQDYIGMIDLLEACAINEQGLASIESVADMMRRLYAEKSFVLNEDNPPAP